MAASATTDACANAPACRQYAAVVARDGSRPIEHADSGAIARKAQPIRT
jgi:hypothetical protein